MFFGELDGVSALEQRALYLLSMGLVDRRFGAVEATMQDAVRAAQALRDAAEEVVETRRVAREITTAPRVVQSAIWGNNRVTYGRDTTGPGFTDAERRAIEWAALNGPREHRESFRSIKRKGLPAEGATTHTEDGC